MKELITHEYCPDCCKVTSHYSFAGEKVCMPCADTQIIHLIRDEEPYADYEYVNMNWEG